MSDSVIQQIQSAIKALDGEFAEVARKEYERGFADGAREAREELEGLRQQLREILGATSAHVQEAKKVITEARDRFRQLNSRGAADQSRAPRGSVEPKVIGAISGSVKGKKPAEIAAETGVPENSVRGMLNKLRKDNRVFKAGDVWRVTGPIREPDGSLVQVTPDGRIISIPENYSGNIPSEPQSDEDNGHLPMNG